MGSLLKASGLEYTEEMISDVVYPDQTQGCYCDYMNETIEIKYGKKFIDSLLNLSDSPTQCDLPQDRLLNIFW